MNADCESKLIIDGWKVGFEKVQFTKMLREELDLGLLGKKAR